MLFSFALDRGTTELLRRISALRRRLALGALHSFFESLDRATEILIRTIIWSRILAVGGRGEDVVLFVVALALLCWALGYASGWLLLGSVGHGWRGYVIALVALIVATATRLNPLWLMAAGAAAGMAGFL